jgi:hypothetical protein
VVISDLGTHLNIAHVNKRNFATGSLPDSSIYSYALGISFRPSECFNHRNARGIFIKFHARISRKGKSKDLILILHGTLYTKSFHRDIRTHKLSNLFSANDNFLSRFESIPELEKSTHLMYHLNSVCEKPSDVCLHSSCVPYNSNSSKIERNRYQHISKAGV